MMSQGLLEKCHVLHARRVKCSQVGLSRTPVVPTSGFPGRTPSWGSRPPAQLSPPLAEPAVAFECGFEYAEQWTDILSTYFVSLCHIRK